MCAIVDANVVNEVFGPSQSPAGEKFYDWINAVAGRLVVGGKLLEELEEGSPKFREWASTLGEAGRMRTVNADQVNAKAEEIKSKCVSDDPHIIALAQISGARLLYTNESSEKKKRLCEDFKDRSLINQPRGKIYTTRKNKRFTSTHKRLLGQRDLCQR